MWSWAGKSYVERLQLSAVGVEGVVVERNELFCALRKRDNVSLGDRYGNTWVEASHIIVMAAIYNGVGTEIDVAMPRCREIW